MSPRSRFALCAPLVLGACGWAWGQPSIGPQIHLSTSTQTKTANETTAAAIVGPGGVHEIVAGWNNYVPPNNSPIWVGVSVTSDGGATWTPLFVRPPAPSQSSVEGDPMTAFDPRTGTLWAGGISFFVGQGGPFLARKTPGSDSFGPTIVAKKTAGADKCWAVAGPAPGDPGATRVYIAYNEGLLRSTDMGDTWLGPVSLGNGIGFLPRVGPAGEVYVLSSRVVGTGLDGVWFHRSLDGGATVEPVKKIATRMSVWDPYGPPTPGSFRCFALFTMAVDPVSGHIYVVYYDVTEGAGNLQDMDLYLTRSTDKGDTWSVPKIINKNLENTRDQFFAWLEVDDFGRVHLIFYESFAANDNAAIAMVDAIYSYSDDGGETWHEAILTPAPFSSEIGLPGFGFIGDYLGMAVAGDKVYPTYMSTQAGKQDIFTHVVTRESVPCAADCNGDGLANVFDFLCFQGLVTGSDPRADCNGDGSINIFDWLCFQGLVAQGC